MLNYGIISTSSIAPRFIAAVRASGAGEIVAISSRSQEKAKDAAEELSIPKAYGSHAELLQDSAVNIVYISSVNSEHFSLAKQALSAGKHVVCEKPCTTTEAETKELFALAREKGLFLMEAQKMLFLPTIIEVAERIRRGGIGDVKMLDFSHSFSAGYNTWLFDPALGGGTLLSSGIYAVQFILWLLGDIRHITGATTCDEGQAEHQYSITGETESGALFCVKNSAKVVLDNCATIYGTKGKIMIPEYWKARSATICQDGKEPEIISCPCEFELSYEAEHIKECLDQGLLTSPVVTEDISVGGIRAIERVKQEANR